MAHYNVTWEPNSAAVDRVCLGHRTVTVWTDVHSAGPELVPKPIRCSTHLRAGDEPSVEPGQSIGPNAENTFITRERSLSDEPPSLCLVFSFTPTISSLLKNRDRFLVELQQQ